MLGTDYDYFNNWEASGDIENFHNTRKRRDNIRGCLKNEIERTSRGGVAKAFIAKRKKPRKRSDENLGHAPRKPKKKPLQV